MQGQSGVLRGLLNKQITYVTDRLTRREIGHGRAHGR